MRNNKININPHKLGFFQQNKKKPNTLYYSIPANNFFSSLKTKKLRNTIKEGENKNKNNISKRIPEKRKELSSQNKDYSILKIINSNIHKVKYTRRINNLKNNLFSHTNNKNNNLDLNNNYSFNFIVLKSSFL